MESRCVIGILNMISSKLDEAVKKKIIKENLPILKNHIPLFYILTEDKTPMLFNEIATKWNISKSSLSDIVKKYENLGLIKKHTCNKDKRSYYISLTDESIKIKKVLYQIEDKILEKLMRNFNENDKALFNNFLDKALSNTSKIE